MIREHFLWHLLALITLGYKTKKSQNLLLFIARGDGEGDGGSGDGLRLSFERSRKEGYPKLNSVNKGKERGPHIGHFVIT